MLDIVVLFALTSPSADLPISPSINLVQSKPSPKPSPNPRTNSKCVQIQGSVSVLTMGIQPKMISMAMSNLDGTRVLDEDVELSDEELELIAGHSRQATSQCSDVFVDGRKIIDFNNFPYRSNQRVQIDYIKEEFGKKGVHISDTAAGILSNHLRHIAPLVIKGERQGFILDLESGQLDYNQ